MRATQGNSSWKPEFILPSELWIESLCLVMNMDKIHHSWSGEWQAKLKTHILDHRLFSKIYFKENKQIVCSFIAWSTFARQGDMNSLSLQIVCSSSYSLGQRQTPWERAGSLRVQPKWFYWQVSHPLPVKDKDRSLWVGSERTLWLGKICSAHSS